MTIHQTRSFCTRCFEDPNQVARVAVPTFLGTQASSCEEHAYMDRMEAIPDHELAEHAAQREREIDDEERDGALIDDFMLDNGWR